MLDLTPEQISVVNTIIALHLSSSNETYAFGSRTQGKARPFSDLDLVIKSPEAIPYQTLIELKDAFSESDLPFLTDITDWQQLSEEFKAAISHQLIKLN